MVDMDKLRTQLFKRLVHEIKEGLLPESTLKHLMMVNTDLFFAVNDLEPYRDNFERSFPK